MVTRDGLGKKGDLSISESVLRLDAMIVMLDEI